MSDTRSGEPLVYIFFVVVENKWKPHSIKKKHLLFISY